MTDLEISERAARILDAVIREYVQTGLPVGSQAVVKRYSIPFSSATIRNDMQDLTRLGLLQQTHVSSGRMPTGMGIRYYLDHILKVRELPADKKVLVQSMYPRETEDIRGVARASSRVLASLTNFTGVVWSPGISSLPIKHVEFLKLSDRRVMAVLVSPGRWFQSSVFYWNEDISPEELNWASDFLNERFQGKTLLEVREEIIEQMRAEKAEFDRMLSRAFKLMESAIRLGAEEEEIFIHGRANLVENPEFADADKMKALFKAFEEKGFVVKLLGEALSGEEFKVLLSSEENIGILPGLAAIIAGYGDCRNVHGTLGVIGPMRMDYPSVIPLVRYTAKYVSSLLLD